MKILHIISSAGLYGAENVLLNLVGLLKKNGSAPYLACLKNYHRADPDVYLESQKQGLPSRVVTCRYRFDMRALMDIRRFAKSEGIQIIHTHGYKSNLYGFIISRSLGIPVVATLHGWTGQTQKVRLYEKLDRWVIRRMDHLVSVAPMICEELASLKLNGTRITFIPNGVDTEKFNPAKIDKDARKKLGLDNSLVIGTVGRLSKEKGHIYLIEAFAKISREVPEARLLIVGDGPLKDSLQLTSYSLQLKDKVIFAGKRDDLPCLYKTMDIFVLPSLTEGLPLVLLEAMSMRLPVVATRVGGMPYVLGEDGGIIVPPRHIEELKNSILLLAKDPSLQRRIGERAREKISLCFSLSSFYEKYMDMYKNIIMRKQ